MNNYPLDFSDTIEAATVRTPQRYYDELAKTYEAGAPGRLDPLKAYVYGRLYKYRALDTLELGCGPGEYLAYCRPSSYVGVDISHGMLNHARAVGRFLKLNPAFIPGYFEATPFAHDSFDVVLSTFGAISESAEPVRAVTEIRRLLRPGGKFYVMLYGRGFDGLNSTGVPVHRYTRAEALRLFESLRVTRSYYLNPRPAVALIEVERYLTSPLTIKKPYFVVLEGEK